MLFLLLYLLLWLLLFLFLFVEHEFKCTVRTITIDYRVHGGVASEGLKSNRGGGGLHCAMDN